jgi:signal transduction histidine kinase
VIEIKQKKRQLEDSYKQSRELNAELEKANAKLYNYNESLIKAMKLAEESERLKSSFLANMSHEIRTPLNAIVGFSTLLVEKGLKSDKRKDFVGIIQSSCDSLLILIDDILDLSRIDSGQLQLHIEKVDISVVFKELLQFLHYRNNNNLDIRSIPSVFENPVLLNTDKVRLKQILINFLTNALKFTDTGYIEMGFSQNESQEITFYVKDTGIGIEDEYQHSVFERFTKIESNYNKLYPGTGLGLAISKRLVEMLGGKIWFDSKAGAGSVFYFTHPLNLTVSPKN